MQSSMKYRLYVSYFAGYQIISIPFCGNISTELFYFIIQNTRNSFNKKQKEEKVDSTRENKEHFFF